MWASPAFDFLIDIACCAKPHMSIIVRSLPMLMVQSTLMLIHRGIR
jgi:hypothetical protein